MAIQRGGRAPYAPTTAINAIIDKHRNVGLTSIDADRLKQIGITEALVSRTLASVKLLGFYDDEGRITPEFDDLKRVAQEDFPSRLGMLLATAYEPVLAIIGEPAQATQVDIENAFRGFEPTGQLSRMVQLFYGLMIRAELMPEDSARKPGPKAGSTPRNASNRTNGGTTGKATTSRGKRTTPPQAPTPPVTLATPTGDLRREYFDLLVAKAKESNGADADLLDRIEKLLANTPPTQGGSGV